MAWIVAELEAKTCQYLHISRDDNIDEDLQDIDDLPNRIVNPDMYQPLLPATDSGERNSQNDTQPQAGINSLVAYGSMQWFATFFQQQCS